MKKLLKKILFGPNLQQEYLCLNLDEFNNSLKMIIKPSNSDEIKDITDHHLFNGYKPLIMTIDKNYLNEQTLNKSGEISMSFLNDQNKILASLKLKLIKSIVLDSKTCMIFQGVRGSNRFKNTFHHFTNNLRYNIKSEKKENIYLAGNLHDQVKIAYSIPRRIYLVTVGSGNYYNIFPTDLSGQFEKNYFIVSLRTNGKANEQIERVGKCLVSLMETDSFEEVYNAGKNHMKDPTDLTRIKINLRTDTSSKLKLPIPLGAIKYFELERIEKFEVGIHTLHFFKIVNSVELNSTSSILAHIHRDYAEWRLRNGIRSNYLIRK